MARSPKEHLLSVAGLGALIVVMPFAAAGLFNLVWWLGESIEQSRNDQRRAGEPL